MAKILWLSGEYLLPADSGLYRYSLDMLNALREMGHEVRAIGRARSADGTYEADDDGIWTVLPHRNVPMWKKMAHPAPVKVTEVWGDDYADAVQEALASYGPDIVLFDHLRVGAALEIIDGTVPSIYVSQNDETRVKEKMIPAANGVRKAALFVDLKKMERFENHLLRTCDGVSAISTADIETFQARHPKGPIVHTLPSYRGTRRPERTITQETPRRVAMISTLYWGAKIDNMVMALRGLKPLIDSGVEVVVFTGGYPPPDEVSRQYPKVRFEGYVDDFDQALADCRVGIVFEPVGGGFKMKTLDFIFHRVPLVTGHTSAMSLPLIPGKSVEEVRSETELAPLIAAMLDDLDRLNDLQNAAFEACRDLFTSESARALSDLVTAITSATQSRSSFLQMALNPKRRVNILGVHVNTLNLPTAVDEIDRWIQDGERHYVCVRDAHGVMLAQKDEKFRQIQNNSGLTTPDGMPMVWCGRWAGEKEMNRVYGPDLIQAVTERAGEKQWKFFYYGGTEGVADELAAEIERRAPGVQNVGTYCPPFRPLESSERAEVIKLINEADPDIVWVGLSSPKQEFWMDDVRPELNAAALIGIGAAYDMLTGRVRQAPRFIQRSGFEWLFRLVMEPRRLWRRYVLNLPGFAFKLARNKPTLIEPE